MNNSSNNKRIAKNTLILYFRMLFAMFVSFYTSRIILEILGVSDYGLYNVVGGIVAMLSFLNSAMSGATSRFITYELGKENYDGVAKTFSAALTVHIIIAIILFIGSETIGLWFFENKLNIDPNRMFAARIVYQLSIVSSIIAITQIPYNASIIANEKMDVYAYVGIYEVLAKLGILFLLRLFDYDQLIVYAILLFVVTASVALIYRVYCVKKLKGCNYHFTVDKTYLKPMLSFSGWDLYGNMCVMFKNQGLNLLLNIFFGTTLNASYSIAQQVNGGVTLLAGNFLTAVKPQMTKLYAKGDYNQLFYFYQNVSKGSYLLLLVFIAPFFFEAPFVVSWWLSSPPLYTIYFIRIMLIHILVENLLTTLLTTLIHASGNIKKISIIRGSIYFLALPMSYGFLKTNEFPPGIIMINLITAFIAGVYTLCLTKKNIPVFSIRIFLYKVLFPLLIITGVSFLSSYLFSTYMEESLWRVVGNSFFSLLFISVITWIFILPNYIKIDIYYKTTTLINIVKKTNI